MTQDIQDKGISLLHLIQICKKSGAGQPPVPGKHTVRALAPYRKRASLQMTDGNLQGSLVCPVIHRKRTVNLWNLYITHNTGTGHIQKTFILFLILFGQFPVIGFLQKLFVVFPGSLQHFLIAGIIQLLHLLRIGSNGSGLMGLIPQVTYCRIQQKGKPCHKHNHNQKRHQTRHPLFLHFLYLFLRLPPNAT